VSKGENTSIGGKKKYADDNTFWPKMREGTLRFWEGGATITLKEGRKKEDS